MGLQGSGRARERGNHSHNVGEKGPQRSSRPSLCSEQMPLDQVVEGHIESIFEHLQDGHCTALLGNALLSLLFLLAYCLIRFCHVPSPGHFQRLGPSPLSPLKKELQKGSRFTLRHLFVKKSRPAALSLSSHVMFVSSITNLVAFVGLTSVCRYLSWTREPQCGCSSPDEVSRRGRRSGSLSQACWQHFD